MIRPCGSLASGGAGHNQTAHLVELSYAKMSEPPVPLVFEAGRDGRVAAVPGLDCRAEPSRCRALTKTDFGTEFSLWRP
jgi:hypothetical protein